MFRTNKEELELYELFSDGSRLKLFAEKLNEVIYPPLFANKEESLVSFEDIGNVKRLKTYYQRYVNDENCAEFWNTWDAVYRIMDESCAVWQEGTRTGLEASKKAKAWIIKKTNEEKQAIIGIVDSINEEEPTSEGTSHKRKERQNDYDDDVDIDDEIDDDLE